MFRIALSMTSAPHQICFWACLHATSSQHTEDLLSNVTTEKPEVCVVQVLLGYREIPKKEAAILSVLNPAGEGARLDPRVWNVGDGRIKLISYKPKRDEKQKKKEQEADNVTEKNALETVSDV